MRKAVLAFLAALFVVGMVTAGVSYAGEEMKTKGTIKSMDMEKGEVVFCPEGTEDHITIKVEEDMVKGIKAGDKVKMYYEAGDAKAARGGSARDSWPSTALCRPD